MLKLRFRPKSKGGWALVTTLIVFFIVTTLMAFLLLHAQDQARAAKFRRESIQALYDALGKLEMARVQIANSSYDTLGRNQMVLKSLNENGGAVPETDVTITPLTGANGTWFMMTARSAYDDGTSERVVKRIFRDRDYFSSYNLFVAADPVGIAGAPIGAIHTNKTVQFYFPNGLYRHAVTAAGGVEYRAGATPENTRIVGPFNANAEPISIDLMGDSNFGFMALKNNVLPDYHFPADRDVKIELRRSGDQQLLGIELYTKPRIDKEPYEVIVGYRDVNPHEVEVTRREQVQVGTETRTRTVTIYVEEEVTVTKQRPVYREETYIEEVPVYRTEERVRQVPIYDYVTKTRLVQKQVWVPDPPDPYGSTTIGGDGSQLGHWEWQWVEEEYQERVIVGYRDETYTVQVVDHYESVEKTRQVIDHYEEYQTTEIQRVPKEVEETYEAPVYEWREWTETVIEYDKEPIYETRYRDIYVPRELVDQFELPAPPNGVVYVEGDIIAIKGEVVGRMTIASEGKIRVTGNIQYKDSDGDTAYLNGLDPYKPYVPNPDYDNLAVLGLIARSDIVYTLDVPDIFEINATLMSMTGRVGIDGVTLNSKGEVGKYNRIPDQWGRTSYKTFLKTSIRRLGGITTYRRPVDTVIRNGSVVSGFKRGASAFDSKILVAPPPFFLARPTPRFFATMIEK